MPDTIRSFKWILLAAALPLALVVAGCDDDDDDNGGPPTGPSLSVTPQIVDPADEVVVQQVRSVGPGWVVIHEDEVSGPGAILGMTAVPGGTSQNVVVTLDENVTAPENLLAILYVDAGTVGIFESADVPARNAANEIVQTRFSVLPTATDPSLSASAQTADSLSTQVVVSQAVVLGPSWVVAHEDDAGQPGAVIGFAPVQFGSNADVVVPLDRPLESGETVRLMLHTDAGRVGTFEFPGADAPTMVNGNPVVGSAVVTVPAGTPAAIVRFTAQNDQNYLVIEVSPMQHRARIIGGQGGQQGDPTLTLNQGWRYHFANAMTATHPLQLIDRGATPASDVILLSQAGAGTLEGNAGIAWTETGNSVHFTLTPELAAAFDGYRCGVHPTTMRGTVNVDDNF